MLHRSLSELYENIRDFFVVVEGDQVGAVVRLGQESGVSVPIHQTVLGLLVAQELAARGQLPRFPRT